MELRPAMMAVSLDLMQLFLRSMRKHSPPTAPTDPAWSHDDHAVVLRDGTYVGRIYRLTSTARELWLWAISAEVARRGVGNGTADTLAAAKAAFKRALEG